MNLPFSSKKLKLKPTDKLLIIESLSIMLSAGIPILESLESIKEDTTTKSGNELASGLLNEISGGKTLSESMALYPDTFDEVFLNIIKSGEQAGNLDKVLYQSAENLKAEIDTINSIRSSLFYPILVIVVLIAVTFYMFAFALPKIAVVFVDMAIDLPAYSSFIMKSSIFFSENLIIFVLVFILMGIATLLLLKIDGVRRKVFYLLIKTPLLKKLVRFVDLSRLTNTSSLLLKAGVPIIQVLDISKKVVISSKLRADIETLGESLTEGATLTEAMKKKKESFPSFVRRLIGVGEETGNLDKSLDEISKYYEKKYTDIINNFTVLLEPILLVLIAIVVGAVLISVIVPIYQGIGQFGPR